MVLSTSYRGTRLPNSQLQRMFLPENYKTSIIVSYKHECLVTVIKPENVASSDNSQHILKIVIFNKFSIGVGACVCAVYLSMCV